MQGMGLGAGLASLAFWGFVAAVVVAGMWYSIRERETQHETLRRVIESGQPIDEKVMYQLLQLNDSGSKAHDRDFKITALWILPVSVGLAVLGLILGSQIPDAKLPILGAAALLAVLGLGFLVASKIVARWDSPDNDSQDDGLMG